LARLVKYAAILLLPLTLVGCFGSDSERTTMMDNHGSTDPQPFPDNYRSEALALMRVYLNNPVGVREATMAEPVLRAVGGRPIYVSCLHFTPAESDGSYRGMRERAIIYVNGRGDRVIDRTSDLCAGAVYEPFPDLEKMTR